VGGGEGAEKERSQNWFYLYEVLSVGLNIHAESFFLQVTGGRDGDRRTFTSHSVISSCPKEVGSF